MPFPLRHAQTAALAFSLAGPVLAEDADELARQATDPTASLMAMNLGDGWSLSAGDLQYSYDWERGRWVNVPLGFQIGKVTKLGSQPVRFALNPQYILKNDRGLSESSVTFTFTGLFPKF